MSALTMANQLTLLRLALVPAFVLLVLYGKLGWALVAFITAGITDGLDGLIARVTNQRTDLGAFLDPMADKLLLVSAFVVLTLPNIGLVNRIPLWLTVLVISRDVVIVATVAIVSLAMGPRTFRPSVFGKVATAIYIVTTVLVMFFNYLGRPSVWVDVGIWTSLGVTLVSGLHYVVHARRLINEPPASS
jgi:cardiolipin synthase